ncbi:LuxR C-terminal-related transcriptional regulator [Actinacidiphila sp. ITFR-21]|uniref:LuxR C-terminal-related transcriptional regulator n=1 Tax=Actinacidiphila sp. ITFR-21 TaxID=3075199 RepID=UPI00288A5F08|nr:LuxR C-terminal-related transcriptional regulator [Streptomyces sp. ITFR-21]WNI20076.1 LuxR C-terminal-related transcriptional regulator [Streptomyces sp. ITFR-21]
MAAILRSAAELTTLTPTQKRVVEKIAAGHSNQQAATELGMKTGTLGGHVMSIGHKFGVASRPAKVHAALASGQACAPDAPASVPNFAEDELRLLHAVATRSENDEIAAAAGIAPVLVTTRIRDLVEKASAVNSSHLIGLAHAWTLLGARTTPESGTPAVPPPTSPHRPVSGGTR